MKRPFALLVLLWSFATLAATTASSLWILYDANGSKLSEHTTKAACTTAPTAIGNYRCEEGVTVTVTGDWVRCASLGGTCTFTGTRQVRYGTATQSVLKTFTGSAACTEAAFDNPGLSGTKLCWYATSETTGTPPAGNSPTDPSGTGTDPSGSNGGVVTNVDQVPAPDSMVGKPSVGQITATTGQVIENVQVSTDYGPCIVISGKSKVTVRNSKIGPCGRLEGKIRNEGIQVTAGSFDITVQGNVIHDVSTALFVADSKHPIRFLNNFVYNIRGPMWQGQMVQFGNVRGGSGSSQILCNVKDGLYGSAPVIGTRSNEDHISMYNTLGISEAQPIEIAYNRIRGNRNGSSQSGSGMMLGDSPAGGGGTGSAESGYYWVHHNTIVLTNGVGIGVAGGHHIRVENNRIDNRGASKPDNTGWSFAARRFDTSSTGICHTVSFTNNRSTIAHLWAFNNDGSAGSGIYNGGGCSYTSTGNDFNDAALTAVNVATNLDATFNATYPECGAATYTPTDPPEGAPTYNKTQIFELDTPTISKERGQDLDLTLRFFGIPMGTNVKPFVHIMDDTDPTIVARCDNHWYVLPAKTWDGYYEYPHKCHLPVDTATGTHRISVGLYQAQSPYSPLMNLVACNGISQIVNPTDNSGCHVGTLTVTSGATPPSTVVTSQQPTNILAGSAWSPL